MSIQSHTPGPWKADHSGFGDATVRAHCGWKNKNGSAFNPTIVDRIDWPTARLIAAAPELLAALQSLIDSEECTLGDGGSILGDDLRTIAREAIAKATGA